MRNILVSGGCAAAPAEARSVAGAADPAAAGRRDRSTNRFADHHQSSALSRRSLILSVEITMRVDLHIHRVRSGDELLATIGAV
jgi:hypothetical protein